MSKPIQIDYRILLRVLIIITGLLIVISLVSQIVVHFTTHQRLLGTVPLFNLDTKQNIPNAFAGFLLLLSALLLTLIALQAKKYVRHWWVLAGGFLLMAFDKMMRISENLLEPGNRLLQLVGIQTDQIPLFDFSWAPVTIMLVTILALFYLRFLDHLPVQHRRQFLLAATVFLSGLIVMDMVAGSYAALYGKDTFMYQVLTTLEESLEMAGTLLFLHALFHYLEKQFPSILVRFQPHKK